MRLGWLLALALALTAGCQSLPNVYPGASDDAKFVFGGKWELKEPSGAEDQ
jgi:hypothetical protein